MPFRLIQVGVWFCLTKMLLTVSYEKPPRSLSAAHTGRLASFKLIYSEAHLTLKEQQLAACKLNAIAAKYANMRYI